MEAEVKVLVTQAHGLRLARLLCPWNSPGKNTEVDCHFHLQGVFPTQGSNLGLLHCRQTLYYLSHCTNYILPYVKPKTVDSTEFTFKSYMF